MAIEFKVPDIGDFKDIPVIEIHVKPGDTVKADDPLVTLESDKATMDVPADRDGTVEAVLIKVGDRVSEGSPVIVLKAAESKVSATPSLSAIDQQEPVPAYKPNSAPPARPAAAAVAADPGMVYASPSVRRLARELEVDLAQVEGSGEKGRITKEDVKSYLRGPAAPAAAAAAAPTGGMGIPEIPAQDFSKFGPVESRPLARIKRLSGPHLHRAWLNVPHVTHGDEADLTDIETYRKELDAAAKEQGYRVTPLAFLMKASVSALKAFPEFNSSLAPDKDALIYKQYYNIGIAVDTPDGLVVPVIKNVDRKGIDELSKELGAVSRKARDGKLGPADLQGGTFTISSLGGIGGTDFTPIVNAPEVAILGVVRSKMQPVWDGKEFQPRLIQRLYVSYDHRVIDGALAARFTRHLCHALEDVRSIVDDHPAREAGHAHVAKPTPSALRDEAPTTPQPQLHLPERANVDRPFRIDGGISLVLHTHQQLATLIRQSLNLLSPTTSLGGTTPSHRTELVSARFALLRELLVRGHYQSDLSDAPLSEAQTKQIQMLLMRFHASTDEAFDTLDAFETFVLGLAGVQEVISAIEADSNRKQGIQLILLLSNFPTVDTADAVLTFPEPRAILQVSPGSLVSTLGVVSWIKAKQWTIALALKSHLPLVWRSASAAGRALVDDIRERARWGRPLYRLDKLSAEERERLRCAQVLIVLVHGLFSTDRGTFDGLLYRLDDNGPGKILEKLSHWQRGEPALANRLEPLQKSIRDRLSEVENDQELKNQLSRLFRHGTAEIKSVVKGNIGVVGWPHNTLDSIESNASRLSDYLLELLPEDNTSKVIFVCHSRGGLVGRLTANMMVRASSIWRQRIVDLITFGTPHEGAELAEAVQAEDAAAYLLALNATGASVSLLNVLAYLQEYTPEGIVNLRPPGGATESRPEQFLDLLFRLERDLNWRPPLVAVGGEINDSSLADWRRRAVSAYLKWRIGHRSHDLVVGTESSIPQRVRPAFALKVQRDHFSYFSCPNDDDFDMTVILARIWGHVDLKVALRRACEPNPAVKRELDAAYAGSTCVYL